MKNPLGIGIVKNEGCDSMAEELPTFLSMLGFVTCCPSSSPGVRLRGW